MASQIVSPGSQPIRLLEWNIKEGSSIKHGTILGIYRNIQDPSKGLVTKETQLRSKRVGIVRKILVNVGQVATPGCPLIELEGCCHPVVMKDMCAECGQDLRKLEAKKENARVSMIPNIPELRISTQRAEELGLEDEERLHKMRKLVLLVDLDQTLIHTSQNPLFAKWCNNNNEDFFTYQLSKNEPTLFTKLRPFCREFIDLLSPLFELQVVTFGSRQYAHKIAEFIDPEKKYFANRILSRDECVNPMRKSGNLRHLFPCGDSMVCIIDDRSDVWNNIPNLILVNKYSYFPGAGDINSPDNKNDSEQTAESQSNKNAESQSNKNAESSRKRKSTSDDEISCKVMKVEKDGATLSSETTQPEHDDDTDLKQLKTTQTKELKIAQPEEREIPEPEQNVDDDLNISSDSDSSNSGIDNDNNASNNENNASNNDNNARNNDNNASNNENNASNNSNTIKNNGDINENNIKDKVNNEINGNNNEHCLNNNAVNKLSKTNILKDFKPPTDYDDYLKSLKSILVLVHSTYYEAYDKFVKKTFSNKPDLRGVIPFLRSKILYGCNAVLTAVIPNNCKGTPQQHKAYVTLEQLGGNIQQIVTSETTHLIAGTKGTRKYQEASKFKNVHFVSPDWLWACSERWEKIDERLFPIPEVGCKRGESPTLRKKERTYDKTTGKLIRESRIPTRRKQRDTQIYSSLTHPEVVVPIALSNPDQPSTSNGPVRERKASMVELFGEYCLSSNDLEDMDREVDDLLSEDEETQANNLTETLQINVESSSSSDDEFDHMADLLNHEMHYDDTEDMDDVD